jgi:hypothetical protein
MDLILLNIFYMHSTNPSYLCQHNSLIQYVICNLVERENPGPKDQVTENGFAIKFHYLIPKKEFIPPAFGLADCCRAGIIQIRSFSARPNTLGEGNLTINYGTTALESRRVGVHALRAYTKAGPSGVGFLLSLYMKNYSIFFIIFPN